MKTYKDELIKSMNYLAEKPNTIFVGQQTAYSGNPMSTTILDVPVEKMIETPVFEEVQMGMSVGLGMTNMCVITFYPRWDFLICAANQLINHLDKFKHMTGYDSHVIIRVGKGSDDPLDPGVQHKADYTDEFKSMLSDIEIINFYDKSNIYETYKKAYENKKPIILVEYPESSIKKSKAITKNRKIGDGKSQRLTEMEDRRLLIRMKMQCGPSNRLQPLRSLRT